jgi:hypothetical protein
MRLMGKKPNAYRVFVGMPKERGHLGYLCIDGRIKLKCTLKRRIGQRGLNTSSSHKDQIWAPVHTVPHR